MSIDTKELKERIYALEADLDTGQYADHEETIRMLVVAADRLAALEAVGERERGADRGSREQQSAHPAITHCDNCGRDWLDNGLPPVGCPYCKQHAQAAEIRALWAERDALLDALRRIAEWPDGGNRYGQENIKRFARRTIDAALAQEDHNG